jgi:hypothetical protein
MFVHFPQEFAKTLRPYAIVKIPQAFQVAQQMFATCRVQEGVFVILFVVVVSEDSFE